MALADLIVLNRNEPAASPDVAESGILADGLVMQTCMRELRVASLPPGERPQPADCASLGFEFRSGTAAYLFLLQLACGLESAIAGETEILGQIRDAWREFERHGSAQAVRLRPWMQRLLQDAREIRSEYVTGLGSASYGSLARRLLGSPQRGTTLLLGAGQLAEAVLPYLEPPEVLVCNRNVERAQALVDRQRRAAEGPRLQVIEATPAAELAAWHRARDVVLCIPADAARDAARVDAWRAGGARAGRLLHLGLMDAAGTPWEAAEGLVTLRELFALRDAQATQRDALLARARRACGARAQLARLDDADGSRPGSACHGWEDLAAFQAFGY